MSVAFRFPTLFSVALAISLPAGAASAQQGTINGRVTDAETGEPIAGASVEALGQGGPQGSNEEGRFTLSVSPGTHSVVVKLIGYETTRVDGVNVPAGGTAEVDISFRSQALVLNPVVITASRHQEKALDAPASISTVSADEIARIAAVTVADHVAALPGIDRAQTGLTQGTVVARGFNNVFSGSLLTIIDNRYARIPSLRFNAYSMFPTTDLDIDRIEVLLGPGAALYGPNAASGVMHLITSSPLDKQGSSVSPRRRGTVPLPRPIPHGPCPDGELRAEDFGAVHAGERLGIRRHRGNGGARERVPDLHAGLFRETILCGCESRFPLRRRRRPRAQRGNLDARQLGRDDRHRRLSGEELGVQLPAVPLLQGAGSSPSTSST